MSNRAVRNSTKRRPRTTSLSASAHRWRRGVASGSPRLPLPSAPPLCEATASASARCQRRLSSRRPQGSRICSAPRRLPFLFSSLQRKQELSSAQLLAARPAYLRAKDVARSPRQQLLAEHRVARGTHQLGCGPRGDDGSLRPPRPARAPATLLNASARDGSQRAALAPERARNAPARAQSAQACLGGAQQAAAARVARAAYAPRLKRNATARRAVEARGSAPSSANRGSPAARNARARAQHRARRAAKRTASAPRTARRNAVARRAGKERAVKCRARRVARVRLRTVQTRARAGTRRRESAEHHADWAYDRARKACSSGRCAQRPGPRAERARTHGRTGKTAAASARRDARG